MDARLLFPSDYVGAADLHGKDVPLTIAYLNIEELQTADGSHERKPVVYFREMIARHEQNPDKENKRMVLNKTNARTIQAMHGNETEDWSDKRITLYPTTCKAFGQTVDCIRVREVAP